MSYEPTREQRRIISHDPSRHGRVLAGPGTGKSATVVAFVARLCSEPTTPRMRLLTFTRAATAELAEKVAGTPQADVERPSTIHSFAIASLLGNPGSAPFPEPLRIADDWEIDQIIAPGLRTILGVAKNVVKKKLMPEMAAGWESLEPRRRPDVSEALRNRFLGAFQQHRRIFGYTLLAELPDLLRRALQTHTDLVGLDLALLVVDEYQDLNACDLEVLMLLARGGTSIVGVGDDEQSIYGFRMAAPEGILRFLNDYPGASDYELTVSHRCGSEIVKWARFIIESNPDRPAHRTRLVTPDHAPNGETAFLSFAGQVTEARGVGDLVEHLIKEEGLDASDILIMSRSDYRGQFSKPIKEELDNRGISVDDPSWVDEVVNADANRRVLVLARLISHRTDSLAWAGLLHLTSGIGPTFQRAIYDRAKRDSVTFAEALIASRTEDFPESGGAAVGKVRALMDSVIAWLDANEPPEESETTWGAWLRDVFRNGEAPANISDDLDYLLTITDGEVEVDVSLDRYLGQIIVLAKDHAAASASGVRFMTMSMSKGLTVEASIVIAAERGVIPDPRWRENEERRLLYVAMTRARRFSYVTMAGRRTGPTAPSGGGLVRDRRNESPFLTHGPVQIEPGEEYMRRRWPQPGRSAGAA